MKCEHCGNEQASGKFCAACGEPFESARCARCEAALLPGARFCTQCGQGVRRGRAMLPWYIAGGALVALIVALLWPALPVGETRTVSGPVGVSPPGAGSPPPLSGSMRENADRLFNRIMEARERGDSAEATRFLPMAITAYQNAGELDDDGLYHLSLLQSMAGDGNGGRATAERILAQNPNHLLGLSAAASAALAAGDDSAARTYYQRIVDAYPAERSKPLSEYMDHGRVLPEIEAEARRFLSR